MLISDTIKIIIPMTHPTALPTNSMDSQTPFINPFLAMAIDLYIITVENIRSSDDILTTKIWQNNGPHKYIIF